MSCRKTTPLVRIRHAVKKIRRRFGHLIENVNIRNRRIDVQGKLKEGYFSVLTIGNNEPKKFQVALHYLKHPPFVKLLEAAAQEFGFEQPGVLVIPCEPRELQRILS